MLNASQVQALLRDAPHTRHAELSQRLFHEFLIFADGRALLRLADGSGSLIESFDEFMEAREVGRRLMDTGPVHPLRLLIPESATFLERVPELLDTLPALLEVDGTALDLSEASLAVIDDGLRRNGSARFLTPELFPALTAYVGEVIRVATAGKWEMRFVEAEQVWEPWIIDPAGRAYSAFMFFKELHEYDESSSSVQGFVGGQLRAHLLRGRR